MASDAGGNVMQTLIPRTLEELLQVKRLFRNLVTTKLDSYKVLSSLVVSAFSGSNNLKWRCCQTFAAYVYVVSFLYSWLASTPLKKWSASSTSSKLTRTRARLIRRMS